LEISLRGMPDENQNPQGLENLSAYRDQSGSGSQEQATTPPPASGPMPDNQASTSVTPVTPPKQGTPRPTTQFNFLNTLIITAISIAGYFGLAYALKLAPFSIPQPEITQFTPRPDPYASWQTYRNEKFGFEFRYPEEFFAQTVPSGSVRITTINQELLDFEGDMPASIEIKIILDNLNNKEFVQKDIISDYQEKQIAVDNRSAQLITGVLDDDVFGWGGTSHGYVFIDNAPFRLEYNLENEEVVKTFDQILSTFRFIDQ